MTDKVQKIRNYACELLKDSQNGFGSASYNMLKMVIAYIDSLPEEPVSEDLNTESMIESYKQRLISQANGMKNSPLIDMCIDMCLVSYKHGINETLDILKLSNIERIVKNWEEPTTEDLGEYINELSKQFPEVSFAKLSRIAVRVAKWKEQQLMAKAIDGDITFDYYGDDDKTYGCIAHDSFCLEDFGLKDRDKVKIIVKEDWL